VNSYNIEVIVRGYKPRTTNTGNFSLRHVWRGYARRI